MLLRLALPDGFAREEKESEKEAVAVDESSSSRAWGSCFHSESNSLSSSMSFSSVANSLLMVMNSE